MKKLFGLVSSALIIGAFAGTITPAAEAQACNFCGEGGCQWECGLRWGWGCGYTYEDYEQEPVYRCSEGWEWGCGPSDGCYH